MPDETTIDKAEEYRRLGQKYSDAADTYNAHLKANASTLTMQQIFPLIQHEMSLRQTANRMFFEASRLEIEAGKTDVAELNAAVAEANEALKRIDRLRDVLDLVADLLVLGSAVIAGKPGPILAALQEVKSDVEAV